jgi:alkylation response protein AidB-like acyl-CoA dehydrogenase
VAYCKVAGFLDTGSGKTFIAVLLMRHRLERLAGAAAAAARAAETAAAWGRQRRQARRRSRRRHPGWACFPR